MYKIAICDDEINVCAEIENYIKRYCAIHAIRIETVVFYTGDRICNYLESEDDVELIFLDIEIPNRNGILVGEYIREGIKNEKIDIVYISSKENYAMQLFKNRPIDFLVKPVGYAQIEKVMDVFVKRIGVKGRTLECIVNKVHKRVLVSDIMYLSSEDKKITLHMIQDQTISFYGKLVEVYQRLPQSMFLPIHKSYVVNCEYVEEYTYERVKIVNGEVLGISKVHRKEVRRSLLGHEL